MKLQSCSTCKNTNWRVAIEHITLYEVTEVDKNPTFLFKDSKTSYSIFCGNCGSTLEEESESFKEVVQLFELVG
jgi:hypothetical protein